MWDLKTKTKPNQNKQLIDKEHTGGCQREWNMRKMGEGNQKVQILSYKIFKSEGCNVQHANYS